jgi:S1-C subfamily serine protease
VVVADVEPGGPAQAAGVQPGDVVAEIDGRAVANLAAATTARYLHRPSDPVRLVVLRGDRQLSLEIEAREKPRPDELTELAAARSLVRRLGILGVDVSPEIRVRMPALRAAKGVLVAARTLDSTAVDTGLRPGDVIHAVNRTEISSVEQLRVLLQDIRRGDPVAIQIERDGKLGFLSFEME